MLQNIQVSGMQISTLGLKHKANVKGIRSAYYIMVVTNVRIGVARAAVRGERRKDVYLSARSLTRSSSLCVCSASYPEHTFVGQHDLHAPIATIIRKTSAYKYTYTSYIHLNHICVYTWTFQCGSFWDWVWFWGFDIHHGTQKGTTLEGPGIYVCIYIYIYNIHIHIHIRMHIRIHIHLHIDIDIPIPAP